jgi:hypothetical protein
MPPPVLSLDDQVAAVVSDVSYAAHADSGVEGKYSQDRVKNALNSVLLYCLFLSSLLLFSNYCNSIFKLQKLVDVQN